MRYKHMLPDYDFDGGADDDLLRWYYEEEEGRDYDADEARLHEGADERYADDDQDLPF